MAAALPSDWKLKGGGAHGLHCAQFTHIVQFEQIAHFAQIALCKVLKSCVGRHMSLFIVHVTHTPRSFQLRRLQKYDTNSLEISCLIRETVVQKLLTQLLQYSRAVLRAHDSISIGHHSKSTILTAQKKCHKKNAFLEISCLIRETVVEKLLAQLLQQEKSRRATSTSNRRSSWI